MTPELLADLSERSGFSESQVLVVLDLMRRAMLLEREECAKVVEAGIKNEPRLSIATARSLAAAIRARGQE